MVLFVSIWRVEPIKFVAKVLLSRDILGTRVYVLQHIFRNNNMKCM